MSDGLAELSIDAAEAGLDRKFWSGKRIVTAAGAVILLGIAAIALLQAKAGSFGSSLPQPTYVDVPPMTVGLQSTDGQAHYLRLSVVLETDTPEAAKLIEQRLPGVIDGFQGFARELRPEDLAGSAGSFRIKEELLRRANVAVAPVEVHDVLIQEMIQQ